MQVCLMVRYVLVFGWQVWWLSAKWAWMWCGRACVRKKDAFAEREGRGEGEERCTPKAGWAGGSSSSCVWLADSVRQ